MKSSRPLSGFDYTIDGLTKIDGHTKKTDGHTNSPFPVRILDRACHRLVLRDLSLAVEREGVLPGVCDWGLGCGVWGLGFRG